MADEVTKKVEAQKQAFKRPVPGTEPAGKAAFRRPVVDGMAMLDDLEDIPLSGAAEAIKSQARESSRMRYNPFEPNPLDIDKYNKAVAALSPEQRARRAKVSGSIDEIATSIQDKVNSSYILTAGFNNSLIGIGYDISLGELPFDPEVMEQDPNFAQEVGAIGFGFLLDAPLFAISGGLGGAAGKAVMRPLAKGVAYQSGRVLRNNLIKKGITREFAERVVQSGLTKNAKMLQSLAGAIPAAGQAIGAGATSLGVYNVFGETMGQMAEGGIPLSEVEMKDVWREGLIGVKMGTALGVMGLGGKYLQTIVKIPTAASFAQRALAVGKKTGIGTGVLATEVSLFAIGDDFLRDDVTSPDWAGDLKMVLGAKVAGAAQRPGGIRKEAKRMGELFKKSEHFDTPEKRKDFKNEYNRAELATIEGYRPEGEMLPFTDKLSQTKLLEIMADPKVSWTTKTKLIYENTGHYPLIIPEVGAVELSKDGLNLKVHSVDAEGNKMLLDVHAFSSKGEAAKEYKHYRDEIRDIGKRREFDDLSIRDKEKVESAAYDAGIDMGAFVDALNTMPENRNADQSRVVRKFYKVWEEAMMPVEGEGTVLKEPTQKAEPKSEPKLEPVIEEPKQKITPKQIPTQPQAEALAASYKERIDKLKAEQPEIFWSVDRPSNAIIDAAAKEGRLVDLAGGMGIVMPDGNLVGLFKYDPTAKGTTKAIQSLNVTGA